MIIRSSRNAFDILLQLRHSEVEEIWVMALFSNKKLIGMERVFRGTVDSCQVFQRDLFRMACRLNATSLLISHNHPSGDPSPSESDFEVTREILNSAKVLGIDICDHIIVTQNRYWSFADNGFPMNEEFQQLLRARR